MRTLPRAAVGALAVLVALGLGVTPAGAATGPTIPLSPSRVELYLSAEENRAPFTEDGGGELVPVEVAWGGAVDLQLPSGVDGSAATYLLQTGAETDEEPTRSLSSEEPGAGHLDVAEPAGGGVRITLPTDATSGPLGLLTVAGLTGTAAGVDAGEDLYYLLEFTGTGSSVVPLAPVPHTFAGLPCTDLWPAGDPADDADCAPYAVTAGTTIGLTLPPESLLRTVGFDAFTDVTATLIPSEPEPDDGFWAGYDAGYTDGRAAGLQAGPDTEHVPAQGPSFDAARAGADSGYEDGYEEGHASGWYEATYVDPGADEDGGTTVWSVLVGALAGQRAPAEVAPAESVAAAAMARVAAAARAVDDVSAVDDGAADPAEQPTPDSAEESDEEVVSGSPYPEWLLPVTVTAAGAELTVPADSSTGEHALLLAVGSDPTGPSWTVYLALDVVAAPAAVVPVVAAPGQPAAVPVLNPGLASNTGWTDPAAGASVPLVALGGAALLVALGGAALLVAGLGAAVVLRPRRRPAAAAQD
ncbi:hypothetical protein [Modestobacter sp. SSW1-42]|uniref:hypothetical protein n=1 Tax=Modestobacter sp. SSW1-42 TaxID=596372 RepID=UPI003986F782